MKELISAVLGEDDDGTLNININPSEPFDQGLQVDVLISALLQARPSMQPPVLQDEPKIGQMNTVVLGSRFWVNRALDGTLMLHLHHPALGWIAWALPPAGAITLAQTLIEQSDKPVTGVGTVQ